MTSVRFAGPRGAVALAVLAVVAALCVALSPVTIGRASAATGCSHITVSGVVKSGSKVEAGWSVAATLHNHAAVLGHGRADSNGEYSFRVCRTASVRRYAENHGGHVNLDVIAHAYHKGSYFIIRTVAPTLGSAAVHPSSHFRVLRQYDQYVNARAASGGGTLETGDTYAKAATVLPPIMYLERVKYMSTDFTIDSSSLHSVATSVGVEGGGYGVDGSLEVEHTAGATYGGRVWLPKGSSRIAVTVDPEIRTTMTYTCAGWSELPFFQGRSGFPKCDVAMDADWTGFVSQRQVAFKGCHDGTWGRNINSAGTDSWTVHAGATYTAKGGFKTPFASADFVTTYGQGTSWTYHFDQGSTVHHFCLSGNGDSLVSSSAVYVQNGTLASTCLCLDARKPAAEMQGDLSR